MYHFSNHQVYHQNTYQQHSMFLEHTKHPSQHITPPAPVACTPLTQYDIGQHNLTFTRPEVSETQSNCHKCPTSAENKKTIVPIKSSVVDTSTFSIEERLVAAVWVHERRNSKISMSQIKHNFRQRFNREAPTKNTLLVWERKLFSTGSVHDAPRPGRPVNRRNHVEQVAASVRSAPALSLRARALALRVPRTTLRTILYNDLSLTINQNKDTGQTTQAGKQQKKRNMKRFVTRKVDPKASGGSGVSQPCNVCTSH